MTPISRDQLLVRGPLTSGINEGKKQIYIWSLTCSATIFTCQNCNDLLGHGIKISDDLLDLLKVQNNGGNVAP